MIRELWIIGNVVGSYFCEKEGLTHMLVETQDAYDTVVGNYYWEDIYIGPKPHYFLGVDIKKEEVPDGYGE